MTFSVQSGYIKTQIVLADIHFVVAVVRNRETVPEAQET